MIQLICQEFSHKKLLGFYYICDEQIYRIFGVLGDRITLILDKPQKLIHVGRSKH